MHLEGSSPRGRGKLWGRAEEPHLRGLIPAWAGKTYMREYQETYKRAHPRVGGENLTGGWGSDTMVGSSPRGRGKLDIFTLSHLLRRLIPAWAGKTFIVNSETDHGAAHPRVGGENST